MAAQDQRYTLFGFSPELDWRPVHFVDSAPVNRICEACGLLPRVNIFMPCGHVLCQSCYEQCLLDDAYACPLDGQPFLEEDAQWAYFSLENLLSRKVKCWNEDHGCEVVLAASDLHRHFYEECGYHCTRCPKCSAFVLRSSMCAHRRSDCSSNAAPSVAEDLNSSNKSAQKAVFMALQKVLVELGGDMRCRLYELVRGSIAPCNVLNELSCNVNALREALAELSEKTVHETNDVGDVWRCVSALGEATSKCLEKLEQSNTELRRYFATDGDLVQIVSHSVSTFQGTLSEALERATETICRKLNTSTDPIAALNAQEMETGHVASDVQRDLLGVTTLNFKHYEAYVPGVQYLKETAVSIGSAGFFWDPVYLGGYYISPGLLMEISEGSLFVSAQYRLHKGAIDKFLKWPFSHTLMVAFVKFSTNRIGESSDETAISMETSGGPAVAMNTTSTVFNNKCDFEYLEREGYIENDQARVKWELVPSESE
ncbi:TNF receptor-associated factor 6-like [Dermacentor albipictus]|uniref:TNF receptor-associated factor 6-like n=1 Tax=Dermacentor albipictus TaxID=60249 RepID=UPI0038FD32BC